MSIAHFATAAPEWCPDRGPNRRVRHSTGGDPVSGLNTTGFKVLANLGTANCSPILVPLPAPILAAGTGLGLAWILRKRMSRS